MHQSLDPELLRTFVAIAEHASFTRAAQALNRTQSAISMQMKRLEEDVLSRQLLHREPRNISLTSEGQALLQYARRILHLHHEALSAIRTPDLVGKVSIGAPDDYVLRFLPDILKRFAQCYPLIEIELHCRTSDELRALPEGTLDLHILSCRPGQEEGELLRREALAWVGLADTPLLDQQLLPLALYENGCFFRDWTVSALENIQRPYRIACSSPSLTAIRAAVMAGLAITVMPRCLIDAPLSLLNHSALPPLPEVSLVLCHNEQRATAASRCLAEEIRQGFRAL
ncbi:LysR substrate-binding domain-containing protein [Atopomonas hussainii]|uniref:LysR substrate-binding domain-containing protein n=1 Tax=Atopomonas hussainii TaxID=1429083 RepID=UPI0008FFE62A|nr:LysR substrate-binding domain-containing protein [Atopomonas hussainii]